MTDKPLSTLIEQTAMELAAENYISFRRAGWNDPKFPNEKVYIKQRWERFLPLAVRNLTQLLSMNHITDDQKQEIYTALIERAEYQPKINGIVVDSKFLEN